MRILSRQRNYKKQIPLLYEVLLWKKKLFSKNNMYFFQYKDRAPYLPYLTKVSFSNTINMAAFVILRHPVTIWVTDSTNPHNLTNDLLILNLILHQNIELYVLYEGLLHPNKLYWHLLFYGGQRSELKKMWSVQFYIVGHPLKRRGT